MHGNRLLIAPVLFLAGCASGPIAIVDGEGAKATESTQHNVTIIAVDGQQYFDGRYIQKLKPGFHYLQLASTKQGSRGEFSHRPFAFVAEACKRYTVYAKHKPN